MYITLCGYNLDGPRSLVENSEYTRRCRSFRCRGTIVFRILLLFLKRIKMRIFLKRISEYLEKLLSILYGGIQYFIPWLLVLLLLLFFSFVF